MASKVPSGTFRRNDNEKPKNGFPNALELPGPTEEVFGQGPSTSMPMFMGNMRLSLLNTFHSIWGWVKTPIPLVNINI
jgi:hypothetical protein